MDSKKKVLASALAAASLAVGSKAQGSNAGLVFGSLGVLGAVCTFFVVNKLTDLIVKYMSVDKEVGVTDEEKEKKKRDYVKTLVEKLTKDISVERGYYATTYGEAPRGCLKVSCGGQSWFVCFVKDKDNGEFVALCSRDRNSIVSGIRGLERVEKYFDNIDLVREKDGLSQQIGMFTWHIVDSLISAVPEANEDLKNAVYDGLYPVMLDKVWNTFSEGQVYFAASSGQASAIVKAAKCNYDNFALSMD